MPTMKRTAVRRKPRKFIAYDLETTRITGQETPIPKYITSYDGEDLLSEPLVFKDSLSYILRKFFLTEENRQSVFVAYNANRFDALLLASEIYADPTYSIEPWLTRSGAFRGMRIYLTDSPKTGWRFSDPMAMFGFQGKLADFLAAFAPEYTKQSIDIEHFDWLNDDHVAYAENDSISLWHGVMNAADALHKVTGLPAQNTIGKTAILYFQSQMPVGVLVRDVPRPAERPLQLAKRGGYVHCGGSFRGPVWKFDVNQAYAAAMRNPLPCGQCIFIYGAMKPNRLGLYHATIHHPTGDAVPFYVRDSEGTAHWTTGKLVTGWLLSPEITYLREHGWHVTVHRGWYWRASFDMTGMVDKLEYERTHCEGGPKGPLGLMIKAVGNNAFGKTLEQRDSIRYIYSKVAPEGAVPAADEDPSYDGIWMVREEARPESYHKPQIGIFITAYARLHLLRTAQQSPSTFLYADTDCVVFTNDMTTRLDIDKARYGAFKVEVSGDTYTFINKKVYYSAATIVDAKGRSIPKESACKGLHPGELGIHDWDGWYDGILPKQIQVQRQQFRALLRGQPLFVDRARTGSFLLPRFAASWYT